VEEQLLKYTMIQCKKIKNALKFLYNDGVSLKLFQYVLSTLDLSKSLPDFQRPHLSLAVVMVPDAWLLNTTDQFSQQHRHRPSIFPESQSAVEMESSLKMESVSLYLFQSNCPGVSSQSKVFLPIDSQAVCLYCIRICESGFYCMLFLGS
jgi:hypothetical protein